MDKIKLQVDQLKEEPDSSNGHDRFSHPAFTRKIPKGLLPCDYDKDEKLMELEFADGNKHWCSIKEFFGVVIAEVKNIYILYPDGNVESMSIVGIDVVKIKRTNYMKLIFERDLPF